MFARLILRLQMFSVQSFYVCRNVLSRWAFELRRYRRRWRTAEFNIAVIVLDSRPWLFFVLATRRFKRELQVRDGFVLVTLVGTVLPAFATLPLRIQLPERRLPMLTLRPWSGLTPTGGTTALFNLTTATVDKHIGALMVWIAGMGTLYGWPPSCHYWVSVARQAFKAETTGTLTRDKADTANLPPRQKLCMRFTSCCTRVLSGVCRAGMSWSDAFMETCGPRWDWRLFVAESREF